MNIHLIDRSGAKGQAREEMIDSLLVAAEEYGGEANWYERSLKWDEGKSIRLSKS
jgi:hypothetical protein